jgi:hypothetical protein
VTEPVEADDLAACLRRLKSRTDRSYGALANRVGASSSSLHRYCSGSAVPPDYAVVERFARVCGATRDDLRALRRLWLAATAAASTEHGAPADARSTTADPTAPGERSVAATAGEVGHPVARSSRAARPRLRLRVALAAVLTAVMSAAVLAMYPQLATGDSPDATVLGGDQRLLLSHACPSVLGLGEREECARELQRLLRRAGLPVDVEGELDVPTRRQVTAFQVLADLPANSIVDARTKRALYEGRVRVRPVPRAQVERMIRDAFPDDPALALAIARCQSDLDPVSVESRSDDGERLWGLFRIPDSQVTALGGTPKQALDIAWNIRAARRLWGQTKAFGRWKPCVQQQ